MKKPKLHEIPIPNPLFQPGKLTVTISPGQWDNLISAAYEIGATLLEVRMRNGKERIARAFRKPVSGGFAE